jgi:hypothetical protein
MTTDISASNGPGPEPVPTPTDVASIATVPAPRSWAWRRGALLLAGGAQLITIAALTSADPIPASWSALLLAIAPVLLAAAAAFGPAPVNFGAAGAGVAVLVIGIAAQFTHAGWLFLPALVVLIGAAGRLWLERSAG